MARSFNGSNQYLSAGKTHDVKSLPFTMACWFNVVDVTNSYTLMALSQSGTDFDFAMIQSRGAEAGHPVSAVYEHSFDSGQTGRAYTSTSITANKWEHACGVFTSQTSRSAYLNGGGKVTNTTGVTAMSIDSDQTIVGALRRNAIIQYTNGRIAFPCIWDVALSDDEVLSLARGTHPSLIRPQNIVALWDLTGGFSPEPDRFGRFGLTLNNSPTVADNPRIILPGRGRSFVSFGGAPPPATFKPYWRQSPQLSTAGVIG
jgi:hypothetical protein